MAKGSTKPTRLEPVAVRRGQLQRKQGHVPAIVATTPVATAADPLEGSFAEVVGLQQARQRAFQAVNTTLIDLHWRIGEYISRKLETAEWGDGVVDELARYLARTQPGTRGFTRRNPFRMRQFYDTYRADERVSALLTQLPWPHHAGDPRGAQKAMGSGVHRGHRWH